MGALGLLLAGWWLFRAGPAAAKAPAEAYTLFFRVDGLSRAPGHELYCRTQRGMVQLFPRQRYEIIPTAYGDYQVCALFDKNLQTRKRTRIGYLEMSKLALEYAFTSEERLGRYFILMVDGVENGKVVYHTAPWPRHEAAE